MIKDIEVPTVERSEEKGISQNLTRIDDSIESIRIGVEILREKLEIILTGEPLKEDPAPSPKGFSPMAHDLYEKCKRLVSIQAKLADILTRIDL